MSYWLSKSGDRDKNFIVLKHSLRGVNHVISGVKFRDGYAVVEKDSKVYRTLKKMPILRNSKEFELTHLSKLKFVTRSADIKMVYGQEVFNSYTKAILAEREKEAELKVEEQEKELYTEHLLTKCTKTLENEALCNNDKFDLSPSGYCKNHLLDDPKLEELGVEIPHAIFGKDNRKKAQKKVIKQLVALKEKPVEIIQTDITSIVSEEPEFGCEHGRLVGQPCPHCLGINETEEVESVEVDSELIEELVQKDPELMERLAQSTE